MGEAFLRYPTHWDSNLKKTISTLERNVWELRTTPSVLSNNGQPAAVQVMNDDESGWGWLKIFSGFQFFPSFSQSSKDKVEVPSALVDDLSSSPHNLSSLTSSSPSLAISPHSHGMDGVSKEEMERVMISTIPSSSQSKTWTPSSSSPLMPSSDVTSLANGKDQSTRNRLWQSLQRRLSLFRTEPSPSSLLLDSNILPVSTFATLNFPSAMRSTIAYEPRGWMDRLGRSLRRTLFNRVDKASRRWAALVDPFAYYAISSSEDSRKINQDRKRKKARKVLREGRKRRILMNILYRINPLTRWRRWRMNTNDEDDYYYNNAGISPQDLRRMFSYNRRSTFAVPPLSVSPTASGGSGSGSGKVAPGRLYASYKTPPPPRGLRGLLHRAVGVVLTIPRLIYYSQFSAAGDSINQAGNEKILNALYPNSPSSTSPTSNTNTAGKSYYPTLPSVGTYPTPSSSWTGIGDRKSKRIINRENMFDQNEPFLPDPGESSEGWKVFGLTLGFPNIDWTVAMQKVHFPNPFEKRNDDAELHDINKKGNSKGVERGHEEHQKGVDVGHILLESGKNLVHAIASVRKIFGPNEEIPFNLSPEKHERGQAKEEQQEQLEESRPLPQELPSSRTVKDSLGASVQSIAIGNHEVNGKGRKVVEYRKKPLLHIFFPFTWFMIESLYEIIRRRVSITANPLRKKEKQDVENVAKASLANKLYGFVDDDIEEENMQVQEDEGDDQIQSKGELARRLVFSLPFVHLFSRDSPYINSTPPTTLTSSSSSTSNTIRADPPTILPTNTASSASSSSLGLPRQELVEEGDKEKPLDSYFPASSLGRSILNNFPFFSTSSPSAASTPASTMTAESSLSSSPQIIKAQGVSPASSLMLSSTPILAGKDSSSLPAVDSLVSASNKALTSLPLTNRASGVPNDVVHLYGMSRDTNLAQEIKIGRTQELRSKPVHMVNVELPVLTRQDMSYLLASQTKLAIMAALNLKTEADCLEYCNHFNVHHIINYLTLRPANNGNGGEERGNGGAGGAENAHTFPGQINTVHNNLVVVDKADAIKALCKLSKLNRYLADELGQQEALLDVLCDYLDAPYSGINSGRSGFMPSFLSSSPVLSAQEKEKEMRLQYEAISFIQRLVRSSDRAVEKMRYHKRLKKSLSTIIAAESSQHPAAMMTTSIKPATPISTVATTNNAPLSAAPANNSKSSSATTASAAAATIIDQSVIYEDTSSGGSLAKTQQQPTVLGKKNTTTIVEYVNLKPVQMARVAAWGLGGVPWKPRQPGQKGLRILSLDGGGTRGVLTIAFLKEIFQRVNALPAGSGERTAKKNLEPFSSFDIICGTSTGGIIAMLLGAQCHSVSESEMMYDDFIDKIFSSRSNLRVLMEQAAYDATEFEKIIYSMAGNMLLLDTNINDCSRVFCVSTKVNSNPPQAKIWRNYNYPPGQSSRYQGSFRVNTGTAIRATTAAPVYFTPVQWEGGLFVDGALVANNPTAIALQEAKVLYPGIPVELVLSIGTGYYVDTQSDLKSIGWDKLINQLVASTTDTEDVHSLLVDFLPRDKYYRFNPMLTTNFAIDEKNKSMLSSLKRLAADHVLELERTDPSYYEQLYHLLRGSASSK